MTNIIREDIVKVGFDIDLKALTKLQEDIDDMKKMLTGAFDGGSFDDMKKKLNGVDSSLDKVKKSANGVDDSLEKVKKSANGVDDSLENVKKSANNADDSLEKVKESANDVDNSFEKAKKSANGLNTKLTNIGKKGATIAFNGLKKVASISFRALVVGVAGVATAVGKIGYEAVQAYADYEQLKGGVETLFKGDAGTVQKYANNAYKTAGLSANDYMETVTGFSASLISSCGGDTKKAAELANMAIGDMSDNANKMGTDMESVIGTYQSLAKGNYAMLDNLKLGYGGTKEELKRLVKDAAKWDKSVDKNSLSYANIVKAIHAVQEKMDIYGTTQKEAEKTVTGSLNAMKSSWGNLLTAMASGENLDQCIDNMVDSVEIFGKNVMPVAERALAGLGTVIERLAPIIAERLPDLAEKLLPPLIKSAVSLAKGLIKALPNIIRTVFDSLVDILGDQFPSLKKFGGFFSDNADKIAKFIPVLIALVAAFKGFKAIKSIASVFGKSGGESSDGAGGFLSGITNTFKDLAKAKPTTILKGMANLAIIIGGFTLLTAAFMFVAPYIAKIGDTASILKMVAIIAVLGIVGTELAKMAGVVGKIPVAEVAKGLANMAIILAGTSVLFLLVGAISLIKFDLVRVLGIVAILGVLGTIAAALSIFAGIVGLIPVPVVALGLANMAIIIAGMSALLLLIGAVSLIGFDLKRIMAITGIIGALGTVGAILSVFAGIVGLIPIPIVLAGLANMVLVLGGITGLIIAFGKLSEIKGFNEFITKGGETLANLFNVIGKIAGSLVGGFGEGFTESLPKIGKNLSNFAKSIKPMFSLFQGVDMGGVGEFFNAIGGFMLKMTGNKILEFFGGEADFSGVVEGLKTLTSEDVKKFFVMVNAIEESAFNKGKMFFDCLDGISKLPNVGGIGQVFSGTNDFEGVASGLGKLSGEGVKAFFAMVNGFEEGSFDKAEMFFESLDNISKLPNVGGLGQVFTGTNDFDGVASGLTALSGEGVKKFFAMVAGFDNSVFDNTTKLFEVLADIGNVGEEGFWERVGKNITGDKGTSGITKIASQLSSFATDTKAFFDQVNNLDIDKLNALWDSLEKAGKLTTEKLTTVLDEGISDLVSKISKLPKKMGDALTENSKDLSDGFVEMWKEAVKASVAPVNKLLDGANHILKEFGSKKRVIQWTPYARGTDGHKGGNALVNDGNGAELVQMPNGNAFIPKGRNVLLPNAPKGMKVLSADRTAKLLGKKSPTFHYADGIGDIDVWSYYDNAKGLVDKLTNSISYDGMSSLASSMGKGMVSTFSGEMPAWVDKLFEECGQSLSSYVASKGVTQWLPTVVRALKMEGQYSLANVARTLFQMKTESGGNPKAINLWDSNAKKGIPSKGLMQVIDPTFRAYARNGFDKNIYDPLSNVLASIRYAMSRYGSLAKAFRGVGYGNGAIVSKPTFGVFGEEGTEANIPLDPTKRKQGLGLWAKAGEMLGMSYTPEDSGDNYVNNTVENNNYSPQLHFHISGTNDDRILARKIKRAVSEAFTDMVDGIDRSNPKLREV